MKNRTVILLAGCMLTFALTACGNKGEEAAAAAPAPSVNEAAAQEEAEPELSPVDDPASDETWASLQDMYTILKDTDSVVAEYYSSPDAEKSEDINAAMEEAQTLIEEIGRYTQETVSEEHALELIDSIDAVLDTYDASVDKDIPTINDIGDIIEALTGTVWLDDELNTYGFEDDGETLYIVPSGSSDYQEGYYIIEETSDGTLGITMVAGDTEIYGNITGYSPESFEYTDITTSEEKSLVPIE